LSKLIVSLILLFTLSVASAQTDDYTIPAPPDDVDLDLVIAKVGDTEITLGDFAQRVRYEQLFYYQSIANLVEVNGENILDLDDPANPFNTSFQELLSALVDEEQFPTLVYDTLIVENLYTQEAVERGITIDDCHLNELWALRLNLSEADCENPSEALLSAKEKYYQDALTFTGLDQASVDQSILAVAQYQSVLEALRDEAPIPLIPARSTRHIRVSSEAQAQEIYERLIAGETTFEEELVYTLDQGALGNRGYLGFIQRGNTVPEFEAVAFSGELGLIPTPVQTQFGYHVIQVNTIEPASSARQIVVNTQEEVDEILRLLEEGAPFAELAERFSIDTISSQNGGDIGTFTREILFPELSEPIFAQAGTGLLDPVETDLGIHIIEVTNYIPVGLVDISHILVETEEEALEIIDLLEDGADFGTLAYDRSIDPSAAGTRGDTLTLFSGGARSGLFVFEETNMEIERRVFNADAEVGTIFEPFQISEYWIILILDEISEREPTMDNVELGKRYYVRDWEEAQHTSGRVETTELWREYIPFDILPSDYDPILSPLDAPLIEAYEAIHNGE
jgi:parvulin-like peptidyl-prolyl isomerase